MKRYRSLTLVVACLLTCTIGHAQVPQLINYQGRLLDGTNLYSGGIELNLRLYNDETAGTMEYRDGSTVTVVDGLYSTYIGDDTVSGTLETALTNAEIWLEVEVNGTTLTPREQIVAVAYALAVTETDPIWAGTSNAFVHKTGDTMTGSVTGLTYHVAGNTNDAIGSVVGGGMGNVIEPGASHGSIHGGYLNLLGPSAQFATIGGGTGNQIYASHSVIGGGESNAIYAQHAMILGGARSVIHTGANDACIIGSLNTVSNWANYGTIIGAELSKIDFNCNYSAIFGGDLHVILEESDNSVIVGGRGNLSGANYTFSGGRGAWATNNGAFVWGGSEASLHGSHGDGSVNWPPHAGIWIGDTLVISNDHLYGNGLRVTNVNANLLDGIDSTSFATGTPLYIESDPLAVLADGSRAMTGDLDMGGHSITNVDTNTIVFTDGSRAVRSAGDTINDLTMTGTLTSSHIQINNGNNLYLGGANSAIQGNNGQLLNYRKPVQGPYDVTLPPPTMIPNAIYVVFDPSMTGAPAYVMTLPAPSTTSGEWITIINHTPATMIQVNLTGPLGGRIIQPGMSATFAVIGSAWF